MNRALEPADPLQVALLTPLPDEVIAALSASPFGPYLLTVCTDRDALLSRLADPPCDAVIITAGAGIDVTELMHHLAHETALLIVADAAPPPALLEWLRAGAQDVLRSDELDADSLALRLRAAIERKRLDRDARMAYATDVETGLPHQQQLIEHMSQLIALREREPVPMALIALRIEGLATTEARLGRAAANVLRRKVGVRLRAGVRASDVVASLNDDHFAVLLGAMLSASDAERVGAKLLRALHDPFKVAGNDLAVATALGIAQYPHDGAQPDALLRRALGLAGSAQAQGRSGFAGFAAGDAASRGAANDE